MFIPLMTFPNGVRRSESPPSEFLPLITFVIYRYLLYDCGVLICIYFSNTNNLNTYNTIKKRRLGLQYLLKLLK